jgi:antitoxin component YwqK of YwqJK toxin-antitoxin module
VDLIEWYEDGKPVKRQQDSRQQGKIDVVSYLRQGQIERQEVDTKYEGRYDLVRFYTNDRLAKEEYDTNGDGRPDVWAYYNEKGDKVLQEEDTEYDGKVHVRFRFEGGRVVSKEVVSARKADGPPRLLGPRSW